MMFVSRHKLMSAVFGLTMLAAPMLDAQVAHAQGATDQQQLVDRAVLTVQDIRKDKEFGTAAELMKRARAVLIVPRIFRAGFFVGGAGGQGVLLTRTSGGWSDPAFYTIASASFGLQIGAQESEMVLFIMSERALHAVMQNQFKIGAQAGISVATLGSQAEAATTSNLNADIISWASSTGAFAGLTIDGSLIKPDRGDDRAYYGRSLTTSQIVFRHGAFNPGASGLREALSSLS